MTIYFDITHFKAHNMSLNKYFIMLMHQDGATPSIKEMQENTKLSERQTIRLRRQLVKDGFLIEVKKRKRWLILSERFYYPEKSKQKA